MAGTMVSCRLTDELLVKLDGSAKAAGRSRSAELLARVEASFGPAEPPHVIRVPAEASAVVMRVDTSSGKRTYQADPKVKAKKA